MPSLPAVQTVLVKAVAKRAYSLVLELYVAIGKLMPEL